MEFDDSLQTSGYHYVTQRPEPIDGTSCAIYYSSESLRQDRSVFCETNDIIGLRACKTALINTILLPERAPHHYLSGTGFLPTRINILLYGAKSSGKKSLPKSFCAEHNYNLILVSFAGFRGVTDLPLVIAKAEACQPCIILFDDCISEFRQARDPRIIGTFQTSQSVIRDRNLRVWNIFTTIEKPVFDGGNGESLHYAFYSAMDVKVWSGDNGDSQYNPALHKEADLLYESDRLAAFIKAIGRYHNKDPDYEPITKQELAELARDSSYCTVGNIFNFVNHLCLEHADRVGISEMINLETNSPTLMPPFQSFKTAILENRKMENGGRITPFNPHLINIRPYSPAFGPTSSDWD